MIATHAQIFLSKFRPDLVNLTFASELLDGATGKPPFGLANIEGEGRMDRLVSLLESF